MVHYLQRLLPMREIPLGSAKSQESRERFSVTNDPVGAFVKAQCALDRTATTPKEELSEAYADYIGDSRSPAVAMTQSRFRMASTNRLRCKRRYRSVQAAYYALVRASEVTLQSGNRYFVVLNERTEMKPLPMNPNVISPIVTLEIRTIPFNAAGAKDAAQIARNSQVAGVKLETATVAALAGLR